MCHRQWNLRCLSGDHLNPLAAVVRGFAWSALCERKRGTSWRTSNAMLQMTVQGPSSADTQHTSEIPSLNVYNASIIAAASWCKENDHDFTGGVCRPQVV